MKRKEERTEIYKEADYIIYLIRVDGRPWFFDVGIIIMRGGGHKPLLLTPPADTFNFITRQGQGERTMTPKERKEELNKANADWNKANADWDKACTDWGKANARIRELEKEQ